MHMVIPGVGAKCSRPWKKVFQALEQSVPSLGRKCSRPWKKMFQALEQSVLSAADRSLSSDDVEQLPEVLYLHHVRMLEVVGMLQFPGHVEGDVDRLAADGQCRGDVALQ